ncbi:MAG: 5'-nucleotidase C-terminal domain-containing protein [Flavobacteriaceae bacterium]
MNFKFLSAFVLIGFLYGCKQTPQHLVKIEGKQISITDSLVANKALDSFIAPYRKHIEKDLDSVLSYAKNDYSKSDGALNSTLGNFFADAVYAQANPIFNKRTGKNIDMVLLNHGGIRAILPKGNITTRTAYQLMPFENSIVVVAMKGNLVDSLAHYLAKSKKAHPISKLKLYIDSDFEIIEAAINGKAIDKNKIYYVATNDYLYNGGDGMTFFKPNDSLYDLNYKVRNALIDYFKKTDTINPVIDDRFKQKQQ